MMKSGITFGLPVLVLGGALAFAQSTPTQTTPDQTAPSSTSPANPNDSTTYATGKPLQDQSKEGFWGHMNPLPVKSGSIGRQHLSRIRLTSSISSKPRMLTTSRM